MVTMSRRMPTVSAKIAASRPKTRARAILRTDPVVLSLAIATRLTTVVVACVGQSGSLGSRPASRNESLVVSGGIGLVRRVDWLADSPFEGEEPSLITDSSGVGEAEDVMAAA